MFRSYTSHSHFYTLYFGFYILHSSLYALCLGLYVIRVITAYAIMHRSQSIEQKVRSNNVKQ